MKGERAPATAPEDARQLHALVAAWAARTPEAEAVVDERGRLTYAALAEEIGRWKDALAAAGVAAGDRVAMLAPPGRESLACLVATVALGAIWSGLDPRFRREEIGQRLHDLSPRLVLAFATLAGRNTGEDVAASAAIHCPAARLVLLPEAGDPADSDFLAERTGGPPPAPSVDLRRPAIIVYTSGSSGEPKGVMLSEAAMLDFARRQNALWPVRPLRTLNFLPVSHAGSVVDLTIPTLAAGGCVVFQRRFDARGSLSLVADEGVTFWASVPSTFILQAALPDFASFDLSAVQLVAMEGAPIPDDLAAAFVRIAPVATNYGMTEACTAICAMPPTRSAEELVGSVGPAFGDAEVRIDAGPSGDGVGEILVRSPRNLLGYWNRPEDTRRAFTEDGFFRTGDLGAIGPAGRLRLAGRKREMFKSGGYNVYPAEVERVLAAHTAVEAVAVIATPHPVWSEVGTAFLVARSQDDDLIAACERLCADALADYKRPKRFVLLDGMPMLPIGKIDRQALARQAAAHS